MQTFFVEIKCALGKTYQVANALAEAEIASEIHSIAGHYDILAKFYVPRETDIGHFVGENVQVPLKQFYPELSQVLLDEIAAYKTVLSGLPPEAASKYPSELSGGMKKRAGLARALALDPELLFLDEPTAGLDPIGAAKFDELLRELTDTLGLTVFLITHDLDTLYAICDRVAVLADGKVIAVGTIAELLASPHPWIQEYFNGPRARAAQASLNRVKGMDKPATGGA